MPRPSDVIYGPQRGATLPPPQRPGEATAERDARGTARGWDPTRRVPTKDDAARRALAAEQCREGTAELERIGSMFGAVGFSPGVGLSAYIAGRRMATDDACVVAGDSDPMSVLSMLRRLAPSMAQGIGS